MTIGWHFGNHYEVPYSCHSDSNKLPTRATLVIQLVKQKGIFLAIKKVIRNIFWTSFGYRSDIILLPGNEPIESFRKQIVKKSWDTRQTSCLQMVAAFLWFMSVEMTEQLEYVISPWEVETCIENLQTSNIDDFGKKCWFEFHKKIMLLNQQSILEINAMREETVKEWFITFKKITVLIYEAIQIDIWKQKVFPILIEINEEPTNTFLLYSIFYHESLATSLLENVLFHSNSTDAIDDSALDLVDYAVNKVTTLFVSNDTDFQKKPNESNTCLAELLKRKFELDFDIAMKCISILRYLAEFLDNLPLCVLSRMLTTHDVPYLLCKLIEKKPWKKENENGESMIYNGKWEIINLNDAERISKIEGQAWIGLRELLLNPKCGPYYEINDFRMSELLKLQKYLHEYILDQISPLIDLRRWLMQLSLSAAPTTDHKTINIELMSQIRSSILEKYHKKWKKLARSQSNYLFTENIQYIRHIAQILSEVYNLDKLDYLEMRKCFGCNEPAKKRCSKCKTAWYCSRECQVKDWINHKINCIQQS